VNLDGGVAVGLLLSAHRAVNFAIAKHGLVSSSFGLCNNFRQPRQFTTPLCTSSARRAGPCKAAKTCRVHSNRVQISLLQ